MPCPLCNDTGEQRYWEGRWRDEKAEIERLRVALKDILTFVGDENSRPTALARLSDIRAIATRTLNNQQLASDK